MCFPNCIGALDSTHIPTVCSPQDGWAFFNHKGYILVILHGVVDHQGHFTHIYASWVGRPHSVRVFQNSLLPNLMESWPYTLRLPDCVIGNVVTPDPSLVTQLTPSCPG